MSDHQLRALDIHNEARREAATHGVSRPPLQWDNGLARDAQKYADYLASIDTTDLPHTLREDRVNQGENLAGFSGVGDFAAASQGWVDERKYYNGEILDQVVSDQAVGHYTQCVWPETTKVGMGIAKGKGKNGWTYIVARYSPAGNFNGLSAWTRDNTSDGGFYLVNGSKDNLWRGGLAWYNSMGGNEGTRPAMFGETEEASTTKPKWGDTINQISFNLGPTIEVSIDDDNAVAAASVGEKVGEATVGGRKIVVKKEEERVLYTTRDGWTFSCLFSAK